MLVDIVPGLLSNERYQKLAVPVENGELPPIRDAQFYIRRNGMFVNAEGWYHPDGLLVGEVLYCPSSHPDRTLFGQPFHKLAWKPGTYDPIPYATRWQIMQEYDPQLAQQVYTNPYFARFKHVFPRTDFMSYFASHRAWEYIVQNEPSGERLIRNVRSVEQDLGIPILDHVSLGLTGSILLGNLGSSHDIDLIFEGNLAQNLKIAKAIRELAKQEPHRRVIESGKGWNIRYYNSLGTFMCNFFTYGNPHDAPLREFTMQILSEDVLTEAVVTDDMHSLYTPSVLGVSPLWIKTINGDTLSVDSPESMRVVVYHTATRGECFSGDTIRARGALVNVHTPSGSFPAVCVIEREYVRNLTPTWENFYDAPDTV